jgi:Xaa-Pro aminopeptidase
MGTSRKGAAVTGRTGVLPVREQARIIREVLQRRLDTILPVAMREAGIDMWVILCQEDDFDPVFSSMMPMDTWCPILQMLVLHDHGEAEGVERTSLAMTNTGGLFSQPWQGRRHEEQWPLLARIIEERDPRRIGVNIGGTQWAAGGLTHNLHRQLVETLPRKYAERLVSAEVAATRWLATLTDKEIELYEHVVSVARGIMADCYSRKAIVPGRTTAEDLEWHYWQSAADLGLPLSFKPFFNRVRSDAAKKQFGDDDRAIRPGDLIHSDCGIRYLRLNSDHQQWAYVLRPGETDAPEGLRRLLAQANRLQDIFRGEFREGMTGNALLAAILNRAREAGVPNPKIYSHSLGLLLHEPGPLIGLPWEQEQCPGRGDVALRHNYAFTMELSVTDAVPEWNGQEVCLSIEEDVVFTRDGCRVIGGRQTAFHLV